MSGSSIKASAMDHGDTLPRGASVNGYRIEKILGRGGFGITYLAHDQLGQVFAIKEYFPDGSAMRVGSRVLPLPGDAVSVFKDWRTRFQGEAERLIHLRCENIVRARTFFEANDTCYLVMDFVEGPTLAEVLRASPGGLAADVVISIARQLLSALRVIHGAGQMHRDIKPSNIILKNDGAAVLIDFGSGREIKKQTNEEHTRVFTPAYAPPEQMIPGLPQGPFSDLYAIGGVCYRLIGGRTVNADLRHAAREGGRPDPLIPAARFGANRYPESLLNTIDSAMAIDWRQRPPTAEAMLRLLATEAIDRFRPVPLSRGLTRHGALAGAIILAGLTFTPPAAIPPGNSIPAPSGPAGLIEAPVATQPVAIPPVMAPRDTGTPLSISHAASASVPPPPPPAVVTPVAGSIPTPAFAVVAALPVSSSPPRQPDSHTAAYPESKQPLPPLLLIKIGPDTSNLPSTVAGQWKLCENAEETAHMIAGCSAIIEAGKEPPADMYRALTNRAIGYLHNSSHTLAIVDFDRALQLNSTGAAAFAGRCWAHFNTGELISALKDCDRAHVLDQADLNTLESRGLVHLRLGNWNKAIDDYNQILKKQTGNAEALYGRGLAYQALKKHKQARQDFEKAKHFDRSIVEKFQKYAFSAQ